MRRFHLIRVRLLEWAAARGFYPAEHALHGIRRTGNQLASCMATRALGRLSERRYYERCAKADAKRLGEGTRR